MARNVTNNVKNVPFDLYGALEAAAGLLVLAGRIENTMIEQSPTKDVKIPRKELYAVAVVGRLTAKIMDNMVYEIEKRNDHIKTMEDIIRILKVKDV